MHDDGVDPERALLLAEDGQVCQIAGIEQLGPIVTKRIIQRG